MKILTVEQVRALDEYTVHNEPIAPINLMERAATAFTDWFMARFPAADRTTLPPVKVFCGLGNNGGDGLAIARLLIERNYPAEVFVVRHAPRESDDFMHNHRRLRLLLGEANPPSYLEMPAQIPVIRRTDLVIDAILGSGLTRPAEGLLKLVIEAINRAPATVVSVDIASGLYADHANGPDDAIIEPDYTVAFQLPKLAFFLPRHAPYVGDWQVVNIGLHPRGLAQTRTPWHLTDPAQARMLLRPRARFSNKGTYGHALLLAGSYGKVGAAVLAARACLRSGVGLLTVQVPGCGYGVMQTAVPEAMCRPDRHEHVLTGPSLVSGPGPAEYTTIGIGPGIGQDGQTLAMLRDLLPTLTRPVVIDADALNLLGANRDLLQHLPPDSILTPHPKEFERLTQPWADEYEKLELLRTFAKTQRVVVVLKGAYTAIALPDGEVHFNNSGNPGLSTGGTGDVLTGILTALLAQGYDPTEAAVLGVYAHGLAGDRAAEQHGQIGLTASTVIDALRWQ
jgi:ADP-dependent NAD(P)H-hydrate dehydratase / NAD(P)H-hydrate epimerase